VTHKEIARDVIEVLDWIMDNVSKKVSIKNALKSPIV